MMVVSESVKNNILPITFIVVLFGSFLVWAITGGLLTYRQSLDEKNPQRFFLRFSENKSRLGGSITLKSVFSRPDISRLFVDTAPYLDVFTLIVEAIAS